ncbi:hypothetical protein ASC61_06775 [Aeromicrobium sp. Root344]|uniref:DUF998 domain-containing protein n=1 Tax=Aeromicrobium sp. Root344 TaxID=1736521 RepID=UPI0006F23065|nr:DUF998 domain-containing protein [Aeromicrobium sp. Root344]KQV74732.1 hypothetical protein ASC61_06775 [Aeromicrobium sp. Root344]
MNRAVRLLLLAGGLLYANWVVQLVLPVHLSVLTSYVSELSALSRPYHQVFRSLDVLSGVLVMAGATAGLVVARRDRPAVAAWAALALFGLSNILDALTPLPCTLTVGAACNTSAPHDAWGWVGDPHLYASLGEEVFFAAALVAVVIALRAGGATVATRGRAEVLGAVAVCASVVAGLLTAQLNFLGHDLLLGLAQRVEVLLMALWIALIPVELVKPPRRSPRGSRRSLHVH